MRYFLKHVKWLERNLIRFLTFFRSFVQISLASPFHVHINMFRMRINFEEKMNSLDKVCWMRRRASAKLWNYTKWICKRTSWEIASIPKKECCFVNTEIKLATFEMWASNKWYTNGLHAKWSNTIASKFKINTLNKDNPVLIRRSIPWKEWKIVHMNRMNTVKREAGRKSWWMKGSKVRRNNRTYVSCMKIDEWSWEPFTWA